MLVSEWSSRKPPVGVRLYGKMLQPDTACAHDQGIMFGLQEKSKQRAIMAPCDINTRFQCLSHAGDNSIVHADAVLLPKPGDSIAFATTDCGAAIFIAPDTDDVVLVHPGRNQLMNISDPTAMHTIVAAALRTLTDRGAAAKAVLVRLFGQIGPEHFPHTHHPSEGMIRAQAAIWGQGIILDQSAVTLDLFTLLRMQVSYYGGELQHVTRIGNYDPYTSPDLASRRGGKLGSNVVVVTRF